MNTAAPAESYYPLTPFGQAAVGRAADEGIPVSAIARIFALPFDEVYEELELQLASGKIVEIPASDWPPTARRRDRLPHWKEGRSDADLRYALQRVLHLTALEAGFIGAMVKVENADKTLLHNVIEQQRLMRQGAPNDRDSTDPKMVDVIICKLRKKLKTLDARLGNAIVTIWGGGYYLEPAAKAVLMELLDVEESAKVIDQS